MKRIYNDIPLESILFTVPGNTKVTVKDFSYQEYRRTPFIEGPITNYRYIWQGIGSESHRLPFRYSNAKVYHTDVNEDGSLEFWTCTDVEKY